MIHRAGSLKFQMEQANPLLMVGLFVEIVFLRKELKRVRIKRAITPIITKKAPFNLNA